MRGPRRSKPGVELPLRSGLQAGSATPGGFALITGMGRTRNRSSVAEPTEHDLHDSVLWLRTRDGIARIDVGKTQLSDRSRYPVSSQSNGRRTRKKRQDSLPGNDGRWFLELAGVAESPLSPKSTQTQLEELKAPPALVVSKSAAEAAGATAVSDSLAQDATEGEAVAAATRTGRPLDDAQPDDISPRLARHARDWSRAAITRTVVSVCSMAILLLLVFLAYGTLVNNHWYTVRGHRGRKHAAHDQPRRRHRHKSPTCDDRRRHDSHHAGGGPDSDPPRCGGESGRDLCDPGRCQRRCGRVVRARRAGHRPVSRAPSNARPSTQESDQRVAPRQRGSWLQRFRFSVDSLEHYCRGVRAHLRLNDPSLRRVGLSGSIATGVGGRIERPLCPGGVVRLVGRPYRHQRAPTFGGRSRS